MQLLRFYVRLSAQRAGFEFFFEAERSFEPIWEAKREEGTFRVVIFLAG